MLLSSSGMAMRGELCADPLPAGPRGCDDLEDAGLHAIIEGSLEPGDGPLLGQALPMDGAAASAIELTDDLAVPIEVAPEVDDAEDVGLVGVVHEVCGDVSGGVHGAIVHHRGSPCNRWLKIFYQLRSQASRR